MIDISAKRTYLWISVYAVLLMMYCSSEKSTSRTETGLASVPPTEWRIFRGDSRLRGRVSCSLPESLIVKWRAKLDGGCTGGTVIDSTQVYVATDEGLLYALDVSDGTIRWKYRSGSSFEASPCLVYDRVVIGDRDGVLHAVDRSGGSAVWTFTTDGTFVGAVNILENHRPLILAGNHNDTLYALDTTGTSVWKYASGSYINGTPATDGRYVAFGGCDEYLHVLEARTGTLRAKAAVGAYVAGSVVIDGNLIWADLYNGKLACFSLDSLTPVWMFSPGDKSSPFYASPAVTENMVIAPSYDGFLYCLSRDSGDLLWKFATKDQVNSAPVVGARLVITGSDDGRVYLVNKLTGTLVSSYDLGAPARSPVVGGGVMVIGDDEGGVNAFRL